MLYAHSSTLTCATDHHCIPCLYKIFPDGSAFGFTLPPNQRPEMCGRSSTTDTSIAGLYPKPEVQQSQDNIKGKKSSSTSTSPAILTIGDGDFSFSLSLSKCLEIDTFVATSYESQESVLSVYKNSRKNIEDLKCKGVKVKHLVDGKDIQETLSDEKYENAFDFIIWNFPCIRAAGGGDAQVADIDENKDLVRRFFSSAKQFLRKTSSGYRGGEIHVTHKTFEPFCWWDILALGVDAGLEYRGSMVFDRYLYPGYVNRKALDNKSFPFIDAQVCSSSSSSSRCQFAYSLFRPRHMYYHCHHVHYVILFMLFTDVHIYRKARGGV
jgi:25S rRNA (uracil2634-N3)-methyltransferase